MRISEKIQGHLTRNVHFIWRHCISSASDADDSWRTKESNMSQTNNPTTNPFVMKYPREQIGNLLAFDVKHEFERLRKELIEEFYQSAGSRAVLIIKRKVFETWLWCIRRLFSHISLAFWPVRFVTTTVFNANQICWQQKNSIDFPPWTMTMKTLAQVLACVYGDVSTVAFQRSSGQFSTLLYHMSVEFPLRRWFNHDTVIVVACLRLWHLPLYTGTGGQYDSASSNWTSSVGDGILDG